MNCNVVCDFYIFQVAFQSLIAILFRSMARVPDIQAGGAAAGVIAVDLNPDDDVNDTEDIEKEICNIEACGVTAGINKESPAVVTESAPASSTDDVSIAESPNASAAIAGVETASAPASASTGDDSMAVPPNASAVLRSKAPVVAAFQQQWYLNRF